MSIDLQLAPKLKEKLEAMRLKAQTMVMDESGTTIAKDFAEVRYSGGYIRGLRDAMLVLDETMQELIEGDGK